MRRSRCPVRAGCLASLGPQDPSGLRVRRETVGSRARKAPRVRQVHRVPKVLRGMLGLRGPWGRQVRRVPLARRETRDRKDLKDCRARRGRDKIVLGSPGLFWISTPRVTSHP